MPPPYYSDVPGPVGGFATVLTPLVLRVTIISTIVGSFFHLGQPTTLAGIATLALVALLFEVSGTVATFLWNAATNCIMVSAESPEHTAGYQWVMEFATQRQVLGKFFWWRGSLVKIHHWAPPCRTYLACTDTTGYHVPASYYRAYIVMYSWRRNPVADFMNMAKNAPHELPKYHPILSLVKNYTDLDIRWRTTSYKNFRGADNLALPAASFAALAAACSEFFKSEKWYAHVGLPFRKCYRLNGPSAREMRETVYALASKLHLMIYTISLDDSVTDQILLKAIATIPKGAIVLIVMKDAPISQTTLPYTNNWSMSNRPNYYVGAGGVTSFGLAEALSSSEAEGLLIFLTSTTDVYDLPAKPGINDYIDETITFGYVDEVQATQLFRRFFPDSNNSCNGYTDDIKDASSMDLAARFAEEIQDNKLTLHDVRKYLKSHQSAESAVSGAAPWINDKREQQRNWDALIQGAAWPPQPNNYSPLPPTSYFPSSPDRTPPHSRPASPADSGTLDMDHSALPRGGAQVPVRDGAPKHSSRPASPAESGTLDLEHSALPRGPAQVPESTGTAPVHANCPMPRFPVNARVPRRLPTGLAEAITDR